MLMKYSKALWREMIFLKHIQENQQDRLCNSPGLRHILNLSLSLSVFLGLFHVQCLTKYLLASSTCGEGFSPGSPSTHSQSPRRTPVCLQGLMTSPVQN